MMGRSQDRRNHLDGYMIRLLKTSKFFEEFEKQETARYFEKMQQQQEEIEQLQAKKKEEARLCAVALKRLVALPNEGVDLDEDDDAIDFLNKSIPAIMIKEMSAQQQYAMLQDMRNMHVDDVINLTGEMQHELNQTFDRELPVGAYITIEDTPPHLQQQRHLIQIWRQHKSFRLMRSHHMVESQKGHCLSRAKTLKR